MRTIGVVTVARSDYGIYLPVLRRLETEPEVQLCLFVSGMHMAPEFGLTCEEVENDGFGSLHCIEMLLASDSPEGVAKSMGLGMIGFAQAYAQTDVDLLLLLGDRFEMMAAAAAATPFNIPLAHLHGGECTEGAIDEVMRHSISKMSHLHFVSTQEYGRRLIQMGEEPWRVHVAGAAGLDNLRQVELLDRATLEKELQLSLDPAPLLVTFHPVTRDINQTTYHIQELLAALGCVRRPIVITYPNADADGRSVIDAIESFAQSRPKVKLIKNLGTQRYFSLMSIGAAMVGNSSSGIIEAASFELPVVNVGSRQRGRIHAANVINANYDRASVLDAIRKAVSTPFAESLRGLVNPYGDGNAAQRIVDVLKRQPLGAELLIKRFYDLEGIQSREDGVEV